MSDQLKPCPFCGGKAELWRAHAERTAWIACMSKCSVLVSKEHKTDAEAIAAWNHREIPAAQPSPEVMALVEALDVLRHAILDALRQSSDMEYCLNLFGLAARTDIPRETLRGIIADMRADGLVSYHKGLWNEDGMPGGAGYAITDAGRAAIARVKGGEA